MISEHYSDPPEPLVFGKGQWLASAAMDLGLWTFRAVGVLLPCFVLQTPGAFTTAILVLVVWGVFDGRMRARWPRNRQTFSALEDGLEIRGGSGRKTVVAWGNVLAMEAWQYLNGYACVLVHIRRAPDERVAAMGCCQQASVNELSHFVTTCAMRTRSARPGEAPASLASLSNWEIWFPFARRAALDAALSATFLLVAGVRGAVLLGCLAYATVSGIVAATGRFPLRPARYGSDSKSPPPPRLVLWFKGWA
jgi:hypothetical protein